MRGSPTVARLIELDACTACDRRTAMPPESGHHHFERTGQEPVVVIQEDHVFARCLLEPAIASRRTFRLPNGLEHPDAFIGDGPEPLDRVIL
jgi:hypothetical protein